MAMKGLPQIDYSRFSKQYRSLAPTKREGFVPVLEDWLQP